MLPKYVLVAVILCVAYCQGDPCIPQEGIPYRIIGRQSNKALDVRTEDGVLNDGASIQLWGYGGGDNQKWKFQRSGNSYIITNVKSGKAIDIDTRSASPQGARVQQWGYGGTPNQRWIIQPSGDGFCKILSESNNKALDAKTINDGADVQVWDFGGGENQQWRLEVASAASGACPSGWGLIKKFDFSSIERIKDDWNLVTWPPGFVNNEKQRYTPDAKNVFSRNGHLILKALRDGDNSYTSGRVESKQTYTPFEAPAKILRVEFTGKVPTIMGAWPAYWILGIESTYGGWPNEGEIDVMEWVQSISGIYKGSLHWTGSGTHQSVSRDFTLPSAEMGSNYITYGVEWSAVPNDEYVQFYMRRANGQVVNSQKFDRNTWSNHGCPNGKKLGQFPCSFLAPFDNHMHLIINLAVGGDWGGAGVTDYNAFWGGVEFETSDVTVCEKLW